MIIPDVNVLVAALHNASPEHARMTAYLEALVNGDETVGLSDAILMGTLRIVTHPRTFERPATPTAATSALSALLAHPNVRLLPTLPSQWRLTAELVEATQAKGNRVAAASHAAHAISHGATFATNDRDFTRFPGLRYVFP